MGNVVYIVYNSVAKNPTPTVVMAGYFVAERTSSVYSTEVKNLGGPKFQDDSEVEIVVT